MPCLRPEVSNPNVQQMKNLPWLCPVQQVKTKYKDGSFVEVLTMLDSGSNTSFISKNVTKKLGVRGPKLQVTVNLTSGQKKSEESELINLTVVPISEETIQKPMQPYAINKPCRPAKTVYSAPRGFSPVFPSPQKSTFPNSDSIGCKTSLKTTFG